MNEELKEQTMVPESRVIKGYLLGVLSGIILVGFVAVCYFLFVFGKSLSEGVCRDVKEEAVAGQTQPLVMTEQEIKHWLSEIDVELQQLRGHRERLTSNLGAAQRAYAIKRNVKGLPISDPDCQRHLNEARQLSTAIDKITVPIGERTQWQQNLQFILQELKLNGLISSTPENSQLIVQIRSRVGAQEFMKESSFLDYGTKDAESDPLEDPDEFMGIKPKAE